MKSPTLDREVTEGVDNAGKAPNGHERQPKLPTLDVHGQRHRSCRRGTLGDRDLGGNRFPAVEDLIGRPTARLVGAAAADQLRAPIPETDDPGLVDEEDAVADSGQDPRCMLALRGGRFGSRACRGFLLRALVQPGGAPGGCHQADQALRELELLLVVFGALVHELHDADDLTLVLDREHHRRLDAGRALVRDLPHVSLTVDVVVDAARILDLLGDVVDEERLAAHDHAALHAAALPVQRQRREDRWVEPLAVDPGVVAADELRLRVERGDDHAAVRHGFGQQLAEAVVDPVELESLVQVARGREQKLGFLCPRVTAHVGIITHVEAFEQLAQRLEGRLVVLEPLGPQHVDGLRAAAADERIWDWMVTRDVEEWIADALREEGRQPFAILQDGVVVGSSSYMSLAPEHLRLEIGSTWMSPTTWSTGANVEAKYLLLRHAFEVLGCRRVEFKTDALNERARGALAALPSEFEGIHRKHMLVRGGERRDSAWYAVIDDDWPDVRAALERRLGG